MQFLGVDLGWHGKPTGVARLASGTQGLRLAAVERLASAQEVLAWIDRTVADGDAVVAVDAPLVITNSAGLREADREISRKFGRYHACCNSANLSRPFAELTTGFSRDLENRGYVHRPEADPQCAGRYQIEVYPHPAIVNLFDLELIIRYKKGRVGARIVELNRYRQLMLDRLPFLSPALEIDELPEVPSHGGDDLKATEDMLDAILAAYVGAHWWHWGLERNGLYGRTGEGIIVVPSRFPHQPSPRSKG
jgi:predicted RNase H-like nuclease